MVSPYNALHHAINKGGTFYFASISPIVSGLLAKQTFEMESITTSDNYSYPKAIVATFVMKDAMPVNGISDIYTPIVTLENGDIVDVNVEFYVKE